MQSSAVFDKMSFQIKMQNFPKSMKVIFFSRAAPTTCKITEDKTREHLVVDLPAQRGRRERKKRMIWWSKRWLSSNWWYTLSRCQKKGLLFLRLIELQKSSINNKPIYIVPSLSFVAISQVAIFLLKITFIFFFFSEQVILIKAYIWFKGGSNVIIFITLTFQKKIPVEAFSLGPMSTVYSGVGDLVGSSVQTSPLRVLS